MISRTFSRAGLGGLVVLLLLAASGNALAQAPRPGQPVAPPPMAPPPVPAQPAPAPAAPAAAPLTGTAPATQPGAQPGAQPAAPGAAQVPGAHPKLSLDDALARFNRQGFDLIIADAQIAMSQADKVNLTAGINPTLFGGVGKTLGYDPSKGNGYPDSAATPCGGCSEWGVNAGITDNAAIMRFLVGKRELRSGVADAAIAAAKMNKEDARRVLSSQVKASYIEAARATKALALATDTRDSWVESLAKFQIQLNAGKENVDSGTVARVETAKLQAEMVVDQTTIAIDSAKFNLLFLLGDRTGQSDFDVDPDTVNFNVPARVNGAALDALLREARDRRPDLKVIVAQKDHAQQGIELAKRERVPDIAVGLNYSQTGTGQNALSPPTLGLGLTIPLPIFYQNQGDIAHAQADLSLQETAEKRTLSQIDTDVRSAWKQYLAARTIIERYESGHLLERAQYAVGIIEKQVALGKGGISFIDLLDARRTYTTVKTDHINALAVYWNAVFALEHAVGADLRH